MNLINKEETKVYVELPKFTGRNVPIKELAEAIGKDANYIRIGLQEGWFPVGFAQKIGSSSSYSYYCPDKMVYEVTGYFADHSKAV